MNAFRTILLLTLVSTAGAQKVELLWPEGAPGAAGALDEDRPTLTIYLPPAASASGAGVVICPGGGYAHLAIEKEGSQIAEWANAHGMAAFVLKYRLGPRYHHPAMLDDAHQALRYVRSHAAEFRIKPDRIGIWGFSAGGHLAATAATHFDASTRPDFAILTYPVITLDGPY